MSTKTLVTMLAILVQCALVLAVAPLIAGLTRQVRARLEGRVGAGLMQPWRDLAKLTRKETLQAAGTRMPGPLSLLVMTTSLLLTALLPLISTLSLGAIPGDLFVIVSVLLLGTVAMALLGLDAGSAFGGMGSSRHMTIAALVEPTVLVAIYALSIPVGTSALPQIVQARVENPVTVASTVSLLALVSLVIVVIAETGRIPVDNPATHLELTMVHEAMILEASGRDLLWSEYAAWVRLTALLGLVANLALPWGIAVSASLLALVVGAIALVVKLILLAALLAAVEVFMAKVRLFKVPELLAGSFVLAFLAVTASYLVA